MANSTVRRSVSRDRRIGQQKIQPLPLVTRRIAAWTVEVSMVVISAVVPFSAGMYIKENAQGTQVALNPVLAATAETITKTLSLPVTRSDRQVPPLTNFLWSAVLVVPVSLTVWQIYLMAKTGSTLPKRWFGVRVVTAKGTVPGLRRVLLREAIGTWGVPLTLAYIIWLGSAFPNLGILIGLSGLMVLAEGISARFNRQRRCWHDQLAGTYVVSANRTFAPFAAPPNLGMRSLKPLDSSHQLDSSVYYPNVRFVMPPTQRRSWWKWMRQHPSLTLLLVSLSSMAAVLATLVGTQIYIQTQKNYRESQQYKSQQFIALLQKLDADATTLDERQKAVLALGTLDNPQSLQLLVDLLGQETKPELIDAIQQAVASTGPRALPYLQTLNKSVANQLETQRYTATPSELSVLNQRLQATQKAIANVLTIYSGKLQTVDLNRINLGQIQNDPGFSLVLDEIDFAGIDLRAANLNQASLQHSRWRNQGDDGQWDTFDDAIADLSKAQLQAVNLTNADLSRVPLNRANLIRANLNQANLAGASLTEANLSSTQLVGANLQAATLTNASLTGADLGEAVLDRANLYAARLGRVNALGTQLKSANLSHSNWQGADLSRADLSNANLRQTDFSNTKLNGANFRNAQLQDSNLRGADLTLADLRGADLTGVDMQGAILFASKSNQPNPFIATLPTEAQSALVEGVDFAKAKNLDAKQLAHICNQGGIHPRCP